MSPDDRDEENEALGQVKLTNISAWVCDCKVSAASLTHPKSGGGTGGRVIGADDSISRRLQKTRSNVFEMTFWDSNARKSVFVGFHMPPLAPADS